MKRRLFGTLVLLTPMVTSTAGAQTTCDDVLPRVVTTGCVLLRDPSSHSDTLCRPPPTWPGDCVVVTTDGAARLAGPSATERASMNAFSAADSTLTLATAGAAAATSARHDADDAIAHVVAALNERAAGVEQRTAIAIALRDLVADLEAVADATRAAAGSLPTPIATPAADALSHVAGELATIATTAADAADDAALTRAVTTHTLADTWPAGRAYAATQDVSLTDLLEEVGVWADASVAEAVQSRTEAERARAVHEVAVPDDLTVERLDASFLLNQTTAAGGISHGLTADGVAADVLQVLGEIVVDRALDQGFDLLRQRVLSWLDCPRSSTSPSAGDGEGNATTARLPETCEAIRTLRIDDLAARPQLLLEALVADVLQQVSTTLGASGDEVVRVIRRFLAMLVGSALGERSTLTADDVAGFLRELGGEAIRGVSSGALPSHTPVQRVMGCALTAVALCGVSSTCNIDAMIDTRAGSVCSGGDDAPEVLRRRARSVASHIWHAFHLSATTATGTDRADVVGRSGHAMDAATELACLALTPATAADPLTETPDVTTCEEPSLLTTERSRVTASHQRIARLLVRGTRVIRAFLENDPTDAAFEAAEAILDFVVFEWHEDDEGERREFARALRLVGGLLTFASTYRDVESDEDIATGHDERRRILESLSAEFTNRTERRGDWIVSLGGSLRLNGGVRFHSPNVAGDMQPGTSFWGPGSLVLGFGLDFVNPDIGFHAELGLFDLGGYLDFDDTLTLRTPSPAAVISPSLTAALSFAGPQVPFIVGVTFGASPFPSENETSDNARRILYFGGVLGFYVPLFDLN